MKPMNKKQLAALYGITVVMLNIWLKPFEEKIGPCAGRLYTPKQIRIIFDCLGEP
jgi:hypothetical protein